MERGGAVWTGPGLGLSNIITMSKPTQINELTTFCNNLGKAFRKFTEENERRFSLIEKDIITLKQKNIKIVKRCQQLGH